jgi:hypothetical protein
MEVQLDSKILNLVASVETDLNKAINEALNLWLKRRIIICPITNQFCKFPNMPCNVCSISKK